MPTTLNGIGTHYYGKKNKLQRMALCNSCGRYSQLESYDTTLFFVVVFIPLVPLGRKRIMDYCHSCTRHYPVSLTEYSQRRSQDLNKAEAILQNDSPSLDDAQDAIALATSYQQRELFNRLATHLSETVDDQAGIYALLGQASRAFNDTEAAFGYLKQSLEHAADPEVQISLAMLYLSSNDPVSAEPLMKHLLEKQVTSDAGLLLVLVQQYQAKGMHRNASQLLRQTGQMYPQLTTLKDFKQLQKIADANAASNEPVKAKYIVTPQGHILQTSNRKWWHIPLIIVVAVLVIVIIAIVANS